MCECVCGVCVVCVVCVCVCVCVCVGGGGDGGVQGNHVNMFAIHPAVSRHVNGYCKWTC